GGAVLLGRGKFAPRIGLLCRVGGGVLDDLVLELRPDEPCRDLRKRKRRSGGAAKAEGRARAASARIERHLRASCDHGEVAVANGDLGEGGPGAPVPRRPVDFLEAFVGTCRGGHWTCEEFFSVQGSRPLCRTQN